MKPTLDEIFSNTSTGNKPSLDQIFSGTNTVSQPTTPQVSKVLEGLKSTGTGIVQSLLGTAVGTARVAQDVGQSILSKVTGTPIEQVKATTGFKSVDKTTPEGQAVTKILTPQNTTESIAKGATDIAQFFIPASSISKARTAVNSLKGEQLLNQLTKIGINAPTAQKIVAGGKLALNSIIEGTAAAGQTSMQTGEIGQDAAISGAIGAALPVIGAGFNLLKKAEAPLLSFTSGVPQKAIQEAQIGGASINKGLKSSVEDIQKQASSLLNDPKTGLYKQLSNEFSNGLDELTSKYKAKLGESAAQAAESFKYNTVAQLRSRGANEAADRLEKNFIPSTITSISQIKTKASEALGNLQNFTDVKEAVKNWEKTSKVVYDFTRGSQDFVDAQNTLKNAVVSNLRKYKVGVKAGETVFDRSSIVKAAEQNNIKSVVDTIKTWKDFSPEGTQALMSRIGALSKFDTPQGQQSSAVLGAIYNDVKNKLVGKFYPDLAKLRTSFDTTKGVLDTIDEVVGASKDNPIAIQAAVTRLSNLFKTDKQTYIDAVRELSNRSGVDILGMLAGTEFQKVLPDFIRGIGGGATVGVGASVLNPYLLLLAPLFSPRAIKNIVAPSSTTKAVAKGAVNISKNVLKALPSVSK